MSANTGTKFELTDYDTIVAEKAEKKNSEKIAKNMKTLGIELEKISLATGLTKEEIENL